MTITHKHCKDCGKYLAVSEFYSRKYETGGLSGKCKDCFNAAAETLTPTKKWCYKCRITKPISEFNKAKGRHDGYQGKCKPCVRAKSALVRSQKLNQAPVSNLKKDDEILALYADCPKGHEVDHIVLLNGENARGLHVLKNLQHLPRDENRHKSNKLLEDA